VLEIHLLGAPEFAYEGQPFRLHGPPRAVTLLAWIVMHRRAPLARDGIAFTFWPDADEDEARANLRRHLYALAKALPQRPPADPWIVADKKTLGWNPNAPLCFDVADLERAVRDDDVEAAAECYRGPLLDGFDEAWIEPERERLQNAVETVLLRALERERDIDPVRAVAYAERLLRVDPWREDALRSLIELRHHSGDRAGALHAYRTFAERLRAELDVPPMAETTALYDAIARGDLERAPRSPSARALDVAPATLPAPVAPLVGRDAVRTEIAAMLESARIVTLVGTGGVGKTRLAIDAAWNVRDAFADGVAFADLGPLGEPALVVTAIAAALGIAQATERLEVATVVATLRSKRLLLVIDNCEHLIAEVARVVDALLGGAPAMVVLATSREPLAVRGERVFRVPSLEVPPSLEGLTPALARGFGALALFEQRAVAADPHFRLSVQNLADVVEICRRLEGIALALELAAARVTMLEPRELARRLDERFRILGGGERTALSRHRTMRALIDWSWDLSSEAERTVLRRVAIFAGGWTLDAAEVVCFFEPLDPRDAVVLAGALVDKSLVVAETLEQGRRYRLLESIRAYALEKLDAAGERAQLGRRHAEEIAAFATRVDAAYESMPDARWFAFAVSEIDNVRAALRWCFDSADAAQLGAALASAYARAWRFGVSRGDRQWLELAYENLDRSAHPELATRLLWQTAAIARDATQHADWVAAAVRSQGDDRTRAEALRWFAEAALATGRVDDAQEALRDARAADGGRAGAKMRAATLELEAEVARARGDVATARDVYARAIAAASACGATALAAKARGGLAELEFAAGETASAIATATLAASELQAAFGATVAVADILARLAAYELARDDRVAAARFAREALTIVRDLDFPQRLPGIIETIGVAVAPDDRERAARAFGFADAMRRRRDIGRLASDVSHFEDARTALRANVGEDVYRRWVEAGAHATEAQIIAEMLEDRQAEIRLA